MNKHLESITSKILIQKKLLQKDKVLIRDLDLIYDFIPPYSMANNIEDIKLIIIGQDPTIRNDNAKKNIKKTLNLDQKNSLRTYIDKVCKQLNIDLDKDVYATNLYKCFFNIPPADDQKILNRHFKIWMDLLIGELSVFKNATVITLGEPLIKQLVHSGSKKVKYYWDYTGNTQSGKSFKKIHSECNYLQRDIYPLPHQPSWSRNKFYNSHLNHYLSYIKQHEITKN